MISRYSGNAQWIQNMGVGMFAQNGTCTAYDKQKF